MQVAHVMGIAGSPLKAELNSVCKFPCRIILRGYLNFELDIRKKNMNISRTKRVKSVT